MSDQSQGPGWWLASDGKWYPPDDAPPVPPPATWGAPPAAPPPSPGMSSGAKVGLIVGLSMVGLLVVLVLAALFLGTESSSSFSSTGSAIGGDSSDSGTTGAGPVEVPDGFALLDGDGVSMAAPEDWQQIEPEDFAMSAEEYANAFPDAPEGVFEQGSTYFERGAVLVAFELTTDFSSNVNVLDTPGEAPLSEVESQVESQLTSFGAENVAIERVDLPVGEAVRVGYTLDVTLPDGSTVPAYGVQYYVPIDGSTYIITVSTRDAIDELADTMADTFRVT